MRNDWVKFAALAGLVVMAGGCRFKGVESFETATTPQQYPKVRGDIYGNGGIARASAGDRVSTRYGFGSDPNSQAPVDPKLDHPAKGSGQQAGEIGGDAAPGHDKSNAPANQPLPTVDSASAH